ncbi:MAG: UDP-N-acetylmuramoyl-tripeptide--D-alanyl-D-alanine ligase [Candidatus Sumerlaeaceae bacterium]
MRLTLQEVMNATGAKLVGEPATTHDVITSISTDTRSLKPGDCFVALKGENFDAHDFLQQAIKAGAAVLVVHVAVNVPSHVVQLVVADTLVALGQLAHTWRSRFTIPVAGLVGSSGKTTTKEMAAEIVGSAIPALSTRGNLNNLIGLPRMLFELNETHQAAVLELGMNLPDENRRLVEIADPDVLLLTNITHAHVGMFGTHEAHYEAEAEAIRYAPERTKLIFNSDDAKSQQARREYAGSRSVSTFGVDNPADVRATGIHNLAPYGYRFSLQGGGYSNNEVELRMFGRHNVSNAVAAAALARHFDISSEHVAQRLSAFQPRLNRSEVEQIDGWYLVKDYYNAIPAAVQLALESLKDFQVPGRRFAVLGDMMELGDFERMYHEQVGESAARAGLKRLFTLGQRGAIIHETASANGTNAVHLPDVESVAAELKQELKPGDLLLLKGSRLMKLERLYELLKA